MAALGVSHTLPDLRGSYRYFLEAVCLERLRYLSALYDGF